MKAYTDLKQSKALAKILPSESADLYYTKSNDIKMPTNGHFGNKKFFQEYIENTPCWSLAALLDVIPQEIFDGEYIINITEGCDNKWVLTYDHYENRNHSYFGLTTGADNLTEACYKMIVKLHELKLL